MPLHQLLVQSWKRPRHIWLKSCILLLLFERQPRINGPLKYICDLGYLPFDVLLLGSVYCGELLHWVLSIVVLGQVCSNLFFMGSSGLGSLLEIHIFSQEVKLVVFRIEVVCSTSGFARKFLLHLLQVWWRRGRRLRFKVLWTCTSTVMIFIIYVIIGVELLASTVHWTPCEVLSQVHSPLHV